MLATGRNKRLYEESTLRYFKIEHVTCTPQEFILTKELKDLKHGYILCESLQTKICPLVDDRN